MRYLVLLVFMLFLSCGTPDPETHIPNLPGYWEIARVTLPDGSQKNFQVNTLIDFIEIKGDSGTRKKLAPNLDGTFRTTKVAERFHLKAEGNNLHLDYRTPYSQWRETVLKSGDNMLEVQNEDGKIYQYKRFQPINLNE